MFPRERGTHAAAVFLAASFALFFEPVSSFLPYISSSATTFNERSRNRRTGLVMERPSGEFQRLDKPPFNPENPNAVLGSIEVPGIEQVCFSGHVQIFPKDIPLQRVKEKMVAWCQAENEKEKAAMMSSSSQGSRPRKWEAYEFIALPARNRTLDAEVVGQNAGRSVNSTRLELSVDMRSEEDEEDAVERVIDMMVDLTADAKEVFGYPGGNGEPGEQPWRKLITHHPWRKWLSLDAGNALPESAVSAFRIVQANWASPPKIAGAMNFTTSFARERFEEAMASPTPSLLKVEVFHSAVHPHVIKIIETHASASTLLDYSFAHQDPFLDGVAPFRAAISPTLQTYTPLTASCRPCLNVELVGGRMMPLVALGGTGEGRAPSAETVREGLKIGLRHVQLVEGAAGLEEALSAVQGCMTSGLVERKDLFVSLVVGEGSVSIKGLSQVVEDVLKKVGGLEYFDLVLLAREDGRLFDNNNSLLALWADAGKLSGFPLPPGDSSLPRLTYHVGMVGTALSLVHLSLLLGDKGARAGGVDGDPGIVSPAVFQTDMHVGDPTAYASAVELCRQSGVQMILSQPLGPSAGVLGGGDSGGGGGGAAGGGGPPGALLDTEIVDEVVAAEHEDVTARDILHKWVLELGGGVVWRPEGPKDVGDALRLQRFFLPPEIMTAIAESGGCDPEVWDRSLSRLLPPTAPQTEEEHEAEAEAMLEVMKESEEYKEAVRAIEAGDGGQWEVDGLNEGLEAGGEDQG